MKIQLYMLLTVCLLMISGCAVIGTEHPELKIFPAAKEGMIRFVITLPQKDRGDEDNFMVEIITGRDMLVDGINRVRLGNSIETHTLKGWGYSYYEVSGSSLTMSTRMAVPDNSPKVTKFVIAPSIKVRYNSRLPIVIYAPESYKVQYRIWKVSNQTLPATKQ